MVTARDRGWWAVAVTVSVLWHVEALMAQPVTVDWVRVVEHATWKPRDSCGEVVHDGRMWLLGGWFDSNSLGPRDVWASRDGADWQEVTHEAGWKHGDIPTSLTFDGRMWMMGGWYAGRLAEGSGGNSVWASKDGARWDCVTEKAGWSPRLGAAGVVHNGRMWLLGGNEQYFFGNDSHLRSDVWSSADGATWTQATAHAPWAPRAFHNALSFQGKLWVFGGGNYLPEYKGYNDVWCSEDGVQWTQVTEHAPWHERVWFSAVVYRGCMWVLGGWSKEPNRNYNDVWYTADGVTWRELKTDTIWSERHEHSAYVFEDKLWIVAGNAWPLVDDVWVLALPENWRPE
jgi:hypothetical protein